MVNGPDTHPVFRWLRLKGSAEVDAIVWNFNMFLVCPDGETVKRFANSRTPSSIKADVEAAIAGKPLPLAPPESSEAQEAVGATASDSPASVLAASD